MRKILASSFLLALIFILQVLGLLRGTNERIDTLLPSPNPGVLTILTALGGNLFFFAFVFFAIYLDVKKHGKLSKETLVFLLSAFLGLVIVGILKVALNEPRPRGYGGFSFPSGHAFRGGIIATYSSNRWKRFRIIAWTYAISVALTRLLLHVHWFSDVLFSLLLAPWIYNVVKVTQGTWLHLYRKIVRKLGINFLDIKF
ncbi:phosphatase PAP2 family protein [Pyrococcus kukulkanii]|uniref:phosphatase PAP2 family protein n=1 Tax=Pyrococcus kukulkanii TaxID=1609559 RepID=UPI003563EF5A